MPKRPRTDADGVDDNTRTSHGPSNNTHKRHKPSTHGKPAPSPNPINPVRARIRSLRRLLAHDDAFDSRQASRAAGMHPERQAQILHSADDLEIASKHAARDEKRARRIPADVRIEHERELRGLEDKLAELEGQRRRKDMISKWHMVRFFERRKAERRLKKVRKEGGTAGAVREAEIAVAYALNYPLDRAYVSLWPKRAEGLEEEERVKGDKEIWALVKKCMEEGTLEDLREGRVLGAAVEKGNGGKQKRDADKDVKKTGAGKTDQAYSKMHSASKDVAGTKAKAKAVEKTTADDEDSDGGFFE